MTMTKRGRFTVGVVCTRAEEDPGVRDQYSSGSSVLTKCFCLFFRLENPETDS